MEETAVQPYTHFRCTECGGPLVSKGNTYVCHSCSAMWPTVDGIPIFVDLSKTPYWGEIPAREMTRLLTYARRYGWRKAAKDFFEQANPYLFRYIVNESRSDWRYLLPLRTDSLVLDAGCGWGAVTLALSEVCQVVAIDYRPERMQFVSIRMEQEQIDAISLACANVRQMPFDDNYFDAVILNGVLEWVGEGSAEHDPQTEQQIVLQEIHRVLKAGGALYIGIENRIGYPYFFGKRDEHSNLRFATLLPRALANAYSKVVRKTPYQTYTHGYRGYQNLLTQTGFATSEFHIPLPNYRSPSYILPFHHRGITDYYLDNLLILASTRRVVFYTISKFLLTLGIWRYFPHSYSILAYKGVKPEGV